ncbi:MAG TPA: GNAT family N-acetyltransferase [Candidatus Saccharimonadia bacterium]|nr:GNAT family N-acetyltransferase [Candidatus Saccharimonadia bacterium]
MLITYVTYVKVPPHLLHTWSAITQTNHSLVSETPESLARNARFTVVAFDGETPIGFAGLMAAHTSEGHGLEWDGRSVIELGSAWVHPEYRKRGIWHRLLSDRLTHARGQQWLTVCVSSIPDIVHGITKMGAVQIDAETHTGLLKALCMSCAEANSCVFCPLSPGTAWRFP